MWIISSVARCTAASASRGTYSSLHGGSSHCRKCSLLDCELQVVHVVTWIAAECVRAELRCLPRFHTDAFCGPNVNDNAFASASKCMCVAARFLCVVGVAELRGYG
jgi:hypothetical protein